jgi:hypothetical protein
MDYKRTLALALALSGGAFALFAQQAPAGRGGASRVPVGPIQSDKFLTVYIRLGQGDEALLYEPLNPSNNGRICAAPGPSRWRHL